MSEESLARTSIRRGTKFRWSIGVKLTVVFLTLVIIPMSFVAYYNLAYAQTAVESIADENLTELSRSTSHHIGLLLTENQRTSATMAGDPVVIEFLAASEEERQNLTPQLYQTLQNFADTHPDYDAPGILDVNGIVVASLAEELVGKNRSFRDYFQASIQGESYISGILVGRGTGRPGIFLTNPVVTADNEIVGINIIWLKADAIWSIIDEVEVGLEGFAYLVDPDGVIIAHPQRDLLYHSLANLSPEAITTINETIRFGTVEGTDVPLIPESLGMEDLASELALAQGPGTFHHCSALDNRSHVVGYARIEQQSWTVVVDLPEDQYLVPLRYLEWIAWLSVGVVGACTFIISILLVHSIAKPIRRLTGAAIAVEKNQSFEPVDIEDVTSGRDEIAYLGNVFSSMVLSLRQEISDRKRAEEKIKEYSDQLEETVEERTKELHEAQEKLVRRERLAILGLLAGGIGHELRNPLGAIKNAAYFLNMVMKKPTPEIRETLEILEKEVATSEKIISSLLDYARPRLPTRSKVNLNEAVQTALSSVRLPGNITVVTQLDETLHTIQCDPHQLGQVFANLTLNAIQAMPTGGQLTIKSEREGPDWVSVSIADTGVGIPEEDMEKLFEPLFTTKAKGIGLGLAIVKTIVDGHEGTIEVESELGKGSVFFIRLPMRIKEED